MKPEFVTVLTDVYCKWSEQQPRYRVYVNEELFAERTWIWTNHYLEEMLQIKAPHGQYTIRYELVTGFDNNAGLKLRNMRVEHGPGRIVDKQGTLEIHNEST
jgi:hypothetical protein